MKRTFLSIGFGALAVVLLASSCFSLPNPGVRFFMLPGEGIAPFLLPIMPNALVNAVAGVEGGPDAAITLFLVLSVASWWLALSIISFLLYPRRKT